MPRYFTMDEVRGQPAAAHADSSDDSSGDQLLVVYRGDVCDVGRFVQFHPGGEDILRRWRGKDVSKIVHSGLNHEHSDNAVNFLRTFKVGELKPSPNASACGQSNDENNNGCGESHMDELRHRDTGSRQENGHALKPSSCDRPEAVDDIESLVDWSRGMIAQVHTLGVHYNRWVHSPVGTPLRLFNNDYIEHYLTNTRWYVVPALWLPLMLYWMAANMVHARTHPYINILGYNCTVGAATLPLFAVGLLFWSLLEYCLHRFVFHAVPPPDSPALITLHFMMHGLHHKCPYDSGRLVFPPVLACILVMLVYYIYRLCFPLVFCRMVLSGALTGYILYDMTHYYMHFGVPITAHLRHLKSYHAKHHFVEQDMGFGIWTTVYDRLFHTTFTKTAASTASGGD